MRMMLCWIDAYVGVGSVVWWDRGGGVFDFYMGKAVELFLAERSGTISIHTFFSIYISSLLHLSLRIEQNR